MSADLYSARMNDQDALMWHIERDPLLRSTMVGVMTFDRSPDAGRLEIALANLLAAMPRLKQLAEPDALAIAPPRWEPDPSFDLGFHVHRVSLPGGSERDVLDLASKLAMQAFDVARPLWQLVLVDRLADDGAAMILKIHHSVTDAIGFFRVLGNLVQAGPDDEIAPAATVPTTAIRLTPSRRLAQAGSYRVAQATHGVGGLARAAARACRYIAGSPLEALRKTVVMPGSLWRMFRPEFQPKSAVMRRRSLNTRLDTITLSLDELKAVAKSSGCTLNDAFLAGLSGGLHRYHSRQGAAQRLLRVNMPVNFRAKDAAGEGGNYFVPARFLLPIATVDPIARMREAAELVQRVRKEPALQQFSRLVAALNVLPALSRPLFGAILKSVDFNASNVPGPPIRLYCAGAEIQAMYPATPLAGAAVSVSLLSYAGRAHLTINTDTGAVPDVEQLVVCIEDSFQELLAEVREQPALEMAS